MIKDHAWQRAFDVPNNASMRPIMEILASVLNCSLLSHKYKTLNPDITKEALSVSITSPEDLSKLIDYFNRYPLLGTKGKDFKDWEKIYKLASSAMRLSQPGDGV